MRVLIVEDSDSICKMIEALLTTRGHEVKSVASGARGLEEAFAWRPSVILLDVNLPGSFDGIDVCKKLQANKETKDLPIVVISASTDEEVKHHAMEAGAAAFYEKPFSPLALLKELEALARRSVPGIPIA
ncbi:MAG TPA: response regulator [Labilithrix sp.]|jgi:DNA-binding response OmpR family regulator